MIKRMRVGGQRERRIQSSGTEDVRRRLQELKLRFDEYDHRMKNHTQMTLSVLAMARRGAINQEARMALDAVASKLKAMAQIQSILQRAGHVQSVRCDDLLRELSRTIQSASPCNFVLVMDSDPLELPGFVALPLGLILNELLTNSIKHGINANRARVRVSLKTIGEWVELRVEDNGPGLRVCEGARRNSGLTLVESLASQLHGQFQMYAGPGCRGVLRFKRADLIAH